MTTLTMKYRVSLDGEYQHDFTQRIEISGDNLAEDGGFESVAVATWNESVPPLKYAPGITARWTGGALSIPIRVEPEMTQKALQEGLPLESVVDLPLTVDFREGREVVRDAKGQAAGVVDCLFANVDWDRAELERAA
jgi:hypothetical protein